VRSAHTISEEQFQQKLKTAGPDAILGVSRVNPKNLRNRVSETPSRLLGASHDVPPAVIQRLFPESPKVKLWAAPIKSKSSPTPSAPLMMKIFQAVCRRRRRKTPGKSVSGWTQRRVGRSI